MTRSVIGQSVSVASLSEMEPEIPCSGLIIGQLVFVAEFGAAMAMVVALAWHK